MSGEDYRAGLSDARKAIINALQVARNARLARIDPHGEHPSRVENERGMADVLIEAAKGAGR